MTCKSCGAQIKITDLTCPYCGTQNREAVEYQKQREKDILEKEKAEAAVKKARINAELQESEKGSRRAMKFLTVFLIVCAAVSTISLIIYGVTEMKYYEYSEIQEGSVRAGSPAETYYTVREKYDDAYLEGCFDFHLCVDSYYYTLDKGDIPDDDLFRSIAYSSFRAYDDLNISLEFSDNNNELAKYEMKYLSTFFDKEFGLTVEECDFLHPEDGYLDYEESQKAGKLLKKKFMEVR